VLVGQALRDGLKTKDQVESFVLKLRAGEVVFQDEVSQGRSKSLGASLSYGLSMLSLKRNRRNWHCCTFSRDL